MSEWNWIRVPHKNLYVMWSGDMSLTSSAHCSVSTLYWCEKQRVSEREMLKKRLRKGRKKVKKRQKSATKCIFALYNSVRLHCEWQSHTQNNHQKSLRKAVWRAQSENQAKQQISQLPQFNGGVNVHRSYGTIWNKMK